MKKIDPYRNAVIYGLYLQFKNYGKVASLMGLSRDRVRMIVMTAETRIKYEMEKAI